MARGIIGVRAGAFASRPTAPPLLLPIVASRRKSSGLARSNIRDEFPLLGSDPAGVDHALGFPYGFLTGFQLDGFQMFILGNDNLGVPLPLLGFG